MMGDFPIEIFLLDKKTDYYTKPFFGKTANSIRNVFYSILRDKKKVRLENYIFFYESLLKIGLGRTITACFKKK